MAALEESLSWDNIFIDFLIPYFLIIHIRCTSHAQKECANFKTMLHVFSFSVSVGSYWLLALTLLPVARVLGSVQFGLSCDTCIQTTTTKVNIGLRLCSPLMSRVC